MSHSYCAFPGCGKSVALCGDGATPNKVVIAEGTRKKIFFCSFEHLTQDTRPDAHGASQSVAPRRLLFAEVTE